MARHRQAHLAEPDQADAADVIRCHGISLPDVRPGCAASSLSCVTVRRRLCMRASLRVNFGNSKASRNVASKEDHVKRPFATLLAAMLFVGASIHGISPAAAQDWPNKPVRIVNTFAPGGAADYLARTVADNLSTRVRPAVLRRDPLRRGRRDRRQLGRGDAARRLQFRHHQHHHAGAGADQQSEARLSSRARPHQHRLSRRLAGRAVGQLQEPDQDARRFRRLREEEREAADLFVVGRRQQRAPVRRNVRPARSASRSSTCPTRARRRACSISSAGTSRGRRRP